MPKMHTAIDWFRDAVPHIKSHQGKTFVILLNSIDQIHAQQTLHDIAYLHSLGIKVVLVHGARDRINQCLNSKTAIETNNLRITNDETLGCVKQANAIIKMDIEAIVSENSQAKIISGNFITAQPLGILNGLDFKHTGSIRNIDTDSIRDQLNKHIVLLSPLGYSSAGEVFNLSSEEVASAVAVELNADKLILLHAGDDICGKNGNAITDLTTEQAKKTSTSPQLKRYLDSAIHACENNIERVHILNTEDDGVLLKELFSSQGFGTMVTLAPYETIRSARHQDAASILTLIAPLIEQDILVARSLETITEDIAQYSVLERDDKIIGTVALISYPETSIGEIACVAIDPDYRKNNRGAKLLAYAENRAKENKLTQLFVMSTQTSHWFMEHGYVATDIDALPIAKQEVYNHARNSKPYTKSIGQKTS